jgi:hypothetical protein
MITLKQTIKIEHHPRVNMSAGAARSTGKSCQTSVFSKPTKFETDILHPVEKTFTIYKLTCQSTKRSYVGCTCDLNRRLQQHITYSANPNAAEYRFAISKAIRQYGIADFELEILDSTDDKDLAFEVMEPGYIELHNTFKTGYNSTKGGIGGKGRINTPSQRKATRLACLRDIEIIKKRLSLRLKNTKWINDGVRSRMIPKNARVPAGFKPGRPAFHRLKKAA